jgi:excisionase family DNA binding protein
MNGECTKTESTTTHVPLSIEAAPDPMTPREVAEILRIGRSTVFDLCNGGFLRHLRVGVGRGRILIFKSDLSAWIEASKQGAAR